MELQDYVAALRHHWRAWVGLTLLGLILALAVIEVSPREYRATAGVFVASTGDSTSGSQFVNQRVRSYPEIAESMAVLGPVIETLKLDTSSTALRAAMTATNPADTSLIDITVTSGSAKEAAQIANAVAEEFSQVAEVLETPASGVPPVDLTVTDPATVPTSPVSPNARLVLVLGLVVGLFLGLALAVARSRLSTVLRTEDELRAAWGDDGHDLVVHAGRPSRLGHVDPATLLAGQLEVLAEKAPLRLVAVSLPPSGDRVTYRLLVDVADRLSAREVTAAVRQAQLDDAAPAEARVRVRLDNGQSPSSLRDWRTLQERYDGVVVVLESGRVRAAELAHFRSTASAAEVEPVAVLLVKRQAWLRVASRRPREGVRLPAPKPRITGGTRPSGAPAGPRAGSGGPPAAMGIGVAVRPHKSRPR